MDVQALFQRRMTYAIVALLIICGINATAHYAVLLGALGFVAAGWPNIRIKPYWSARKVAAYVNDIAFSGLAAYAMVLSVAAYVTGFLLRAMFS